jgi:glycosyltransferase involved in cell wall biosynthesis
VIASVIVPAHNEEFVVTRGLAAMLADAEPDEFDVIVVSNGSSDATATRAREYAARTGHPVRVLELARPSKIAALRAGAGAAAGGVRVYVDADVVLPTQVLRDLVAALDRAGDAPRAGCPAMTTDTSGSSWPVRAYYRAWTQLPYVTEAMVGSGVFGLTAAGSARVGDFPDVLNDDGLVRRSFAPAERLTTPGAFHVVAPRTAAALVRRRARIAIGNRDLDQRTGGSDPGGNGPGALLRLARTGQVAWPDAAAFVLVTALARGLAQWRRRTGNRGAWSTDQTSRAPGG